MTRHATREAWLVEAVEALRPLTGFTGSVHVSVGFPRKLDGTGECWCGTLSQDGAPHIFISPTLRDEAGSEGVLATLVHELGHARVGVERGHGAAFRSYMRSVGLEGKPTATVAGARLHASLAAVANAVGPYPHAVLHRGLKARRPGSRLRLWTCNCNVRVRVASDDFRATCRWCGSDFARRA